MTATSSDAPPHQRGYRIHAWGDTPVLEPMTRPDPGPGEVLVEVEACGVGLTVLNCINGDLANDPELLPRVPGHEYVGRVVEAGAGADSDLLGRRVVAYFYLSCGRCPACTAGHDSLCSRLAGWVGVHRDGGYAPYATLPDRNAVAVPDALDPVAATVVADAVATPVHVCRTRAQVGPDDRVAVIGAGGGVGIHMVQVARLLGAQVAGLDLGPEKLAAIEDLGAVPVDATDLPADPGKLWRNGAPTVVIDLVGAPETLDWSVDAIDTGGRLVVLTTFRDRSLSADPRVLVFKEAAVVGSRYASRSEVALAGELVARGDIAPVIGAVSGPDEVLSLHDRLREGTLIGRGALSWKPTEEAAS